MKKIFLLSAIAISSFIYNTANAQIGVQFHINLGARPGYVEPAPVYDDAAYYYLPEVAAYYSVNQHCYYYNDGYNWVSATYLPGRYHDYDWQHARRYAVNEARPYLHDDVYRARYHGGFEGRPNWANHDDHDNRVYADRDGRGYQNNQRWNDNRGYQPQQRNDQNHGYGMAQPQQRNDHFEQQPQQGNDHGRDQGGYQQQNDRNQWQHNDHDARGNNDRGGRNGRFSS